LGDLLSDVIGTPIRSLFSKSHSPLNRQSRNAICHLDITAHGILTNNSARVMSANHENGLISGKSRMQMLSDSDDLGQDLAAQAKHATNERKSCFELWMALHLSLHISVSPDANLELVVIGYTGIS
jgi:hypothetical protein